MKTELQYRLDLLSLRVARQTREDQLLKQMFLGRVPFDEKLYGVVQDNQMSDMEAIV